MVYNEFCTISISRGLRQNYGMLIISFITNLNERYLAITKALSVFITIQNVCSVTIVHVEFKLNRKKDVCSEYKIAPSTLTTFLKNE